MWLYSPQCPRAVDEMLEEMCSLESEAVLCVRLPAGWVCIQNRDCPLSRGLVAGLVQIRARFRPLATTPSVAASSLDSARTLFFPLRPPPFHSQSWWELYLIDSNLAVLSTWLVVIAQFITLDTPFNPTNGLSVVILICLKCKFVF